MATKMPRESSAPEEYTDAMTSGFKDEGDMSVLRAIGEHAEMLSRGKKSFYRPWLLVLGGGIRGIYGAAAATQLEAAALTDGFAGCVGVSTGAATCAYFLSKQGALGTTFYYEECVGREFFSPWRILLGGSGVEVAFLTRVMRGVIGLKQLNQRRVKASSTKLFVAVTEADSGNGVLIDAKHAEPDIVQAIEASMAIPNFYRRPVLLGNKRYIDGGVGLAFPAKELIEQFSPTHLLVLANRPELLVSPLWYRVASAIFSPFMPSFIRESSSDDQKNFKDELAFLRTSGVPHLIIWTSDRVSAFTQKKQIIREGMAESRSHMRRLLEQVGF